MGLDATVKTKEESAGNMESDIHGLQYITAAIEDMSKTGIISEINLDLVKQNIPVIILGTDPQKYHGLAQKVAEKLGELLHFTGSYMIFLVDNKLDIHDYTYVAWQVLGNSDPLRDHFLIGNTGLVIDGTIKAFRSEGFSRHWPNVVCADEQTIFNVDRKWEQLGLGHPIMSPSLKILKLRYEGNEMIEGSNITQS